MIFLTYENIIVLHPISVNNNGFPLMALKPTYMWNIAAKLAKLQNSIFSRVNPNIDIIYNIMIIAY